MSWANNASPKPAGRKEWVGAGVLSIACLIYSMDLSILFLAIPAIVSDLDPSASELLWINDIYGFMVAGFLVTMGTLGDRIGRRRVLLLGAAAFGVASALAAFSNSALQLIASRALLGIAGATVAPSTLSLIVNLFENEDERHRAIGIWGTAFALGGLIGPLLGGFLLQYFHWGAVFLINIPAMLTLLVVGPILLPEFKNPNDARLDLASVLLSLAAVLPFIYGLKHMAADGFALVYLLAVAAGLFFCWLFVRRQTVLAHPLIDLNLFAIPAFTASLLVNLTGMFFVFGVFLYQNLFLQFVIGLTPLQAALWSVPSSIVFTIMSLQAYRFTNCFGQVRTVLLGLVIYAAGMFLIALAAYFESLVGVLSSLMVIAVGFVPVVLTTTSLIVGTAPPERSGSASAISETSAELGGALGVALLGSLGTLIYRLEMQTVDVTGLDPAQATAVKTTIGGAVEIANTLRGGGPPVWLDTARHSFSTGFTICCLLAAVTSLILAAAARRIYALSGIEEKPIAAH